MSAEAPRERIARLMRGRPGLRPGSGDVNLSEVKPAEESSAEALPGWFRARNRSPVAAEARAAGAGRTVGEPRELRICGAEAGDHALREITYDAEHRHGAYALGEIRCVEPDLFGLLARDEAFAGVDLERAVYLDTETTGLSGGAGVYVFLVGLGFFRDGALRLEQFFLRGPDEERALLEAVAMRIAGFDTLVSFFGKSFDRHRLEDKMRIAGVTPPFEAVQHLDLYYVCNRLYGRGLPDGRLRTVEAALCGVERVDDLPGSAAPEAWFDFLAGRPHRLEGVFQHNADDILSLVTLAAHTGRARIETRADGCALEGPASGRAEGLARLHLKRGERSEALHWLERALGRTGNCTEDRIRIASDRQCLEGLAGDIARRIARSGGRGRHGRARSGVPSV